MPTGKKHLQPTRRLPGGQRDSWRLNLIEEERFKFHDGTRESEVCIAQTGPGNHGSAYPGTDFAYPGTDLSPSPGVNNSTPQPPSCNVPGQAQDQAGRTYIIRAGGQFIHASGKLEADGSLAAIVGATQRRVEVVEDYEHLIIFDSGYTYRLKQISDTGHSTEEEATGNLISSMPGRVVEVMVNEGRQVKKGDTLLVLEAMKIEHVITAPHDGTVQSLYYHEGDMVEEGVELLVLADK